MDEQTSIPEFSEEPPPDETSPSLEKQWEFGALGVLIITCSWSYYVGLQTTDVPGRAVGQGIAAILLSLLVVGIAHLIRRRSRIDRAVCILGASAWVLVGSTNIYLNNLKAKKKVAQAPRNVVVPKPPPASPIVPEEAAWDAGIVMVEAIRSGKLEELNRILEVDRFYQRMLRGQNANDPLVQGAAEGGRKLFTNGDLFRQYNAGFGAKGSVGLVKCYEKEGQTRVQIRLVEENGTPHYLDAFVVLKADGTAGIEDLKVYDSGSTISETVMRSIKELPPNDPRTKKIMSILEAFNKFCQDGKKKEAFDLLSSLPPDTKRKRIIMRLYVQMALEHDPELSEHLMAEYKSLYPGDESLIFLSYFQSVAREDFPNCLLFMDQIDEAIGGDVYLIWYRGYLAKLAGRAEISKEMLGRLREHFELTLQPDDETSLFAEFMFPEHLNEWLVSRSSEEEEP